MRDFDTLGSKLGPKLARLISQTIVATKRALGPHEHAIKVKAAQDVIDRAGREVASLHKLIFDAAAELNGNGSHAILDELVTRISSGEHQWEGLAGLGNNVAMGALGSAVSNFVFPLTATINEVNRNTPVSPDVAAQAVAAQLGSYGEGDKVAAAYGYTGSAFQIMTELARNYPGISDALDMLRRGILSQAEFTVTLQRQGVPDTYVALWLKLRNILLPPADAALAVLRGNLTQEQGAAIAAQWGMTAADFQVTIDNTGEPLGLEQLLEAYRRGFIDKPTLERGIRQSRVRNEWIPTAEKLRYSPLTVADAVNAVVQNYLTSQDAASIAEQNGLAPGAVATLIQTAGEPLSRTETEQLYNRGLMTRDDVIQALRESRLKNKYNDFAFDLHTKILEPRTLSSAVEFGSISYADAVKHAIAYGYSAADAAVLIGEGSARKLQSYKNRVITAAESLYEASGMSETDFRSVMHSMGFTAEETGFVVQAADFRKKEKQVTTTVNAVRAKYIAHHLTDGQASAILDKSGLLAAQRDQLLATWKTERSAVVRNLTEAQIIKAMKKKTITMQDADDRLLQMGYSQVDAAILIADE